jgi:hypothetical protein
VHPYGFWDKVYNDDFNSVRSLSFAAVQTYALEHIAGKPAFVEEHGSRRQEQTTTQAFNGTIEVEGEGLGRLSDGRSVEDKVHLAGAMAVVVVTDGEGSLNGVEVKRGDRLVVAEETEISAEGTLSAIVCFKAAVTA